MIKEKLVSLAESITTGALINRFEKSSREDEISQFYQVIMPSFFTQYGTYDLDEMEKKENQKSLSLNCMHPENFIARYGDIVMKLTPPYDAVMMGDEVKSREIIVPSFCAIIRNINNNVILPDYLLACLNSEQFKDKIRSETASSTVNIVNLSFLKEIEIPVLPRYEQERIGNEYKNSIMRMKLLNEIIKLEKEKNSALLKDAWEDLLI